MVWMVQHVQKPTLLYGGYNALEGNTPLLNELPVLLNAPVKDDLHTTIVALCVQFGNTYFTVFHLLPGASGFLLGGRNDGWGAVVPADAGTQRGEWGGASHAPQGWIPAFAGMVAGRVGRGPHAT